MTALLNDPARMSKMTNTPDLGDLTFFNNRSYGGIGADEVNSDRAKSLLNNIHKYDSDAKYTPSYSSDGNLMGYTLQFDPSKLPGTSGNGSLGGSNPSRNGSYAGGSSFMPRFSTVQDRMNLANPNAVAQSDHYGRITDNRNIYDKLSLLDIAGPLAVGGFGMLAGGGGALASLLQKAPGVVGGMAKGNFNPFQMAGMALPFVPGVSPFMSTLGRMGLNAIGSQQRRG